MSAGDIDALRPPTALRLLTIWQESRERAQDPLERSLLCNAQVLAESCFCQGAPVFPDGEAVLAALTAREMETLLRLLAEGGGILAGTVNPGFDQARFDALREG